MSALSARPSHRVPAPSVLGSLEISIETRNSTYNLRVTHNDYAGMPQIYLHSSSNVACPLIGRYVNVRIDGKINEFWLSNLRNGLAVLQYADASVQAAMTMAVIEAVERRFQGAHVRLTATSAPYDAWDMSTVTKVTACWTRP
jgi:hypothetical protein